MVAKKSTIVHCKGYQKGESPEAQRNRTADLATPEAVLEPAGHLQILLTLPKPKLLGLPS